MPVFRHTSRKGGVALGSMFGNRLLYKWWKKACAGRMNPAGISYFYLAQDSQTAYAEVIQKPPCTAALACFKPHRDLRLLNLGDIPSTPSVF
ncbi:MAG: RES family NAD+ phosphorylase [Desulfotalea sp.]